MSRSILTVGSICPPKAAPVKRCNKGRVALMAKIFNEKLAKTPEQALPLVKAKLAGIARVTKAWQALEARAAKATKPLVSKK